jgi:hypothetical protein
MKKLKISFDIGGVLSKYPNVFRHLLASLSNCEDVSVYVLTDMPIEKAQDLIRRNGFDVEHVNILSANYDAHGERCKEMLIEENGIDIHIDGFPDYCAHTKCVSLMVWPNPHEPYYHDDFLTDGSEGNFARRSPNAQAAPQPRGEIKTPDT